MFTPRLSSLAASALALALLPLPLACLAQATPGAPTPPRSWVDKDTGHRVWRLSDEPNSGGFYFNINAYTPDGKQMIYTAPDGIHVLDMATMKTKLLVAKMALPFGQPFVPTVAVEERVGLVGVLTSKAYIWIPPLS